LIERDLQIALLGRVDVLTRRKRRDRCPKHAREEEAVQVEDVDLDGQFVRPGIDVINVGGFKIRTAGDPG
jgi:hypothetical protein